MLKKNEKLNFNLGGEQSGHIILGKFNHRRWIIGSLRSIIFT